MDDPESPHRAPGAPNGRSEETALPGHDITRRDFLQLLTALGLTLSAGVITVPRAARAAEADGGARPGLQTCGGMRQPNLTGRLTDREASDMWALFAHIGEVWDNRRYCVIASLTQLRPVLDAKTHATPSYLTEYRTAVGVLAGLRRRYGNQEALRRFFFDQPDPCVRQYTVAELLNLQVSQGGFRRFGYANYAGFMAGPFDDPARLPYRSWRDYHP